jgi:hypothetical protein
MESMCSGCGAVAESHPYVGVTRDQETQAMTAYPICHLCWADPSHRQHPLKMHFYEARLAPEAVDAAERNILVDPPTIRNADAGDEPTRDDFHRRRKF